MSMAVALEVLGLTDEVAALKERRRLATNLDERACAFASQLGVVLDAQPAPSLLRGLIIQEPHLYLFDRTLVELGPIETSLAEQRLAKVRGRGEANNAGGRIRVLICAPMGPEDRRFGSLTAAPRAFVKLRDAAIEAMRLLCEQQRAERFDPVTGYWYALELKYRGLATKHYTART